MRIILARHSKLLTQIEAKRIEAKTIQSYCHNNHLHFNHFDFNHITCELELPREMSLVAALAARSLPEAKVRKNGPFSVTGAPY